MLELFVQVTGDEPLRVDVQCRIMMSMFFFFSPFWKCSPHVPTAVG